MSRTRTPRSTSSGLSPNASRLNVRYWLVGTVCAVRRAVGRARRTPGNDRCPTERPAARHSPTAAGDGARGEGHRSPTGRRGRAGRAWRISLSASTLQRGRSPHPRRLQHESSPCGDPESLSHPQPKRGGARGTEQGTPRRGVPTGTAVRRPGIRPDKTPWETSTAQSRTPTSAPPPRPPRQCLPRLLRLHHHHLEKLPTNPEEARREKRTKGFFEQLVQEICSHVGTLPVAT